MNGGSGCRRRNHCPHQLPSIEGMAVVGDHAIENAEGDRLGRMDFAAELAHNIRAVDGAQGYVFGLLGLWGSGKTSLCNLITEKLQQDPPLPVIEFNPWMFSGAE